MTELRFDTYYTVEQLDDVLHQLAKDHPTLVHLDSIGKSHEGRDIFVMTINDFGRGPDTDKPAFWMDGNMHSGEVTGSMAALYMAHRLLSGFGEDEVVTRLIERMAFYLVPRPNPDGAALFFTSPHRQVRSGTRPYPYDELEDGLHEEDVDGNGKLLTMRVEDPTGSWKACEDDPRLMVPRDPLEEGGTYYRLFPEGRVRNYDGHIIKPARPREGIDFNRNYPASWAPESVQKGAGPFPLSEPETALIAAFISEHRNISGAINYHTTGGAFFRPSSVRPDSELPEHDVKVYDVLAEHTKRLTGYRTISTHHEFAPAGRSVLHGGFLDWLYDEMGIFSYSPELWDYPGQAGVERPEEDGALQAWYYSHSVEEDLKIMRWLDEEYEGRHIVPWRPFDHPDLGPIEIGGIDDDFIFYNAPPEKLEEEISKMTEFCLIQASLAPLLTIRHLGIESLGGDAHRVRLVVENTGFLPSSGSEQAQERGVVRPVRAELEGGEVWGPRVVELGHLQGRSSKLNRQASSATDNRAVCEWLVKAAPGTELTVHALSDRAGSIHEHLKVAE